MAKTRNLLNILLLDRYELREDRQREVVRSIGHLEGLKYQLLSVLAPHHSYQEGDFTKRPHSTFSPTDVTSASEASLQPPQPPPRFVDPGEVASIPGLKVLSTQIQALCEEVSSKVILLSYVKDIAY